MLILEIIHKIVMQIRLKATFSGRRLPLSIQINKSRNSNVSIKNVRIRRNTTINVRAGGNFIAKECFIGENCIITVRGGVEIDEYTNIGPHCCIFDHDHDYRSANRLENFIIDGVYIGKNVWIGANVTILKGTHIGDNSVVAAGSVVSGTYDSNSLIAGVPSTLKKNI